jgi:hypothetical protein
MLISQTDFVNYRELTANLDYTDRLDPFIRQAQQFDIKQLLGEKFYADLTANPATTANAKLLNGGTYTDGGYTYEFTGLKAALVMFTYARLIQNQNVSVTRFGVVFKNNGDVSERVDEKTLQRLTSNARDQAVAYWKECEVFICRNDADYPLYCHTSSVRKGGLTLSGVGGDVTKYQKNFNNGRFSY